MILTHPPYTGCLNASNIDADVVTIEFESPGLRDTEGILFICEDCDGALGDNLETSYHIL